MVPVIRKRIPASDDAAIQLLIRSLLVPYARRNNPSLVVSGKELKQRLDRGFVRVIESRRGSRRPGAFMLFLTREGILWIDMLAVHPDHQGKGWGRRLMDRAERFGRKRGCTSAKLYVDLENEGAQRFYLNRGYQAEQYISVVNCYLMSKPLEPL